MKDKKDSTGNGFATPDEKVVRLPTLAERDAMRREKELREKAAQKAARRAAQVPFFNAGKMPFFTRFLIVSFLLVQIPVFVFFNDADRLQAFYFMGFVPGYFTGAAGGFPWFAPLGIITHMFIHGSWMHLLFNITMGLALTMFFETVYGTRAAAFFFFACGIAGAALYFILNPFSTVPVIGASGGLSGLFGAVLILLHDRQQLGPVGRYGPWPLIGFWSVFMIVIGLISGENMAWQAHVGGFLAGAGLLTLMKKGTLKL